MQERPGGPSGARPPEAAPPPSTRLETNEVGQLIVPVGIGDARLRWILDTGASTTVVEARTAARLGLRTAAAEVGAGAGGQVLSYAARVERLVIVGRTFAGVTVAVMDLSHVNRQLGVAGARPIEGVLGSDLLRRGVAVIDYRDGTLAFAEPRTPG